MFNTVETPTPDDVLEEEIRIAAETLVSVESCLDRFEDVENNRISETVWISYFLDKLAEDGLLSMIPDYHNSRENLTDSFGRLTKRLFILLGQITDRDFYCAETQKIQHVHWIRHLMVSVEKMEDWRDAVLFPLPRMQFDCIDLWMLLVYFHQDPFGSADIIRRRFGRYPNMWQEKMNADDMQNIRVPTPNRWDAIYHHRKRVGGLYLIYNHTPNKWLLDHLARAYHFLQRDLIIYRNTFDLIDRINMQELLIKLLILYIDAIFLTDIRLAATLIQRLIDIELNRLDRPEAQQYPQWCQFVQDLHLSGGDFIDCYQSLLDLCHRVAISPLAIGKGRLLMMTYFYKYYVWTQLSSGFPADQVCLDIFADILKESMTRDKEGLEAKACMQILALGLRKIFFHMPQPLIPSEGSTDPIQLEFESNEIITVMLSETNFCDDYDVIVRIFENATGKLQDAFFQLSASITKEMQSEGVVFTTQRDFVERMELKRPILFEQYLHFMKIYKNLFHSMSLINQRKTCRHRLNALERLWMYFHYVQLFINFNYLMHSETYAQPLILIASFWIICVIESKKFNAQTMDLVYRHVFALFANLRGILLAANQRKLTARTDTFMILYKYLAFRRRYNIHSRYQSRPRELSLSAQDNLLESHRQGSLSLFNKMILLTEELKCTDSYKAILTKNIPQKTINSGLGRLVSLRPSSLVNNPFETLCRNQASFLIEDPAPNRLVLRMTVGLVEEVMEDGEPEEEEEEEESDLFHDFDMESD